MYFSPSLLYSAFPILFLCLSPSYPPPPSPPYLSSRHPSSWDVWSSSPWIRSATSAHVTPRSVSDTTSVYACTCNLHVQYLGGKVSEIAWVVTAENPLLFCVEFCESMCIHVLCIRTSLIINNTRRQKLTTFIYCV